jgi:putative DNA primase/helicase
MTDRSLERGTAILDAYIAQQASAPTYSQDYGLDVILTKGSDITPEPVTWLWNGWLAAGKMHILGGAPGSGKTTIALALAATVTNGGRWPDCSRAVAGGVAIWSGEDDPADTLVPRLALSGADLSRIHFITGTIENDERRAFDPASDIEPLRRNLAELNNVRLLIVDPIVSAITGDSHKNAEVRRGLQPLADLAASMNCAVLGITHFTKGTGGRDPVERLTGSLAFGALARIVMVAAKHQEKGEEGTATRLFCRAKSNIGTDSDGFEYELQQSELATHPGVFASYVRWGDAVEGAARDLLAEAETIEEDGGSLADAKTFLSGLLAEGAVPAKTIRADADGAGYSWATIRRAQRALGVIPVKEGGRFGGGKQQWVWTLPAANLLKVLKNTEDAQQNLLSTFKESEHLQEKAEIIEDEI